MPSHFATRPSRRFSSSSEICTRFSEVAATPTTPPFGNFAVACSGDVVGNCADFLCHFPDPVLTEISDTHQPVWYFHVTCHIILGVLQSLRNLKNPDKSLGSWKHGTFGRESHHPCSWEICGTDVEDGNLATDLSSLPVFAAEEEAAAAAEAAASDAEGFWRTLGMLCSLLPALLAPALPAPGEASAAPAALSGSKRRVESLLAVNCGSCGGTASAMSGVLKRRRDRSSASI